MSYSASANVSNTSIPSHVPSGRVIDWDYFNPPGVGEDPHLAWRTLHSGPDIVYTPHNGGHWIVTRADDMYDIMHDTETFSSREFTVPQRGPETPKLIPNQIDPPFHWPLKSIVLRSLGPPKVKALEPIIRKLFASRIEQLKPLGRCEFGSAFSTIPPEVFFELAQLPKSQIQRAKELVDIIVKTSDDEARTKARQESAEIISGFLDEWRKRPPSDDLLGVIVAQERAGVLTPEESIYFVMNVYHGGLETVHSALSFFIWFLARNPGHRRQLIEDPSLCTMAAEEMLRRHGILNLARVTTKRTEFRGVTIEAGEMVMLPLHLAGIDDRKYDKPLEVDFHRTVFVHPMFGTGVHRCVGSHLARPELRIFLEEWMKAIPDFRLDPNDPPVGRSGIAMSMARLPIVWDV